MSETRRSAFARPARTADAPTPTPVPTLPVPGDVARFIIDAAVERSGSVAALEAALRAEVAHFRACSSPSCPRRAKTRAAYCRECLAVRRQTREGVLVGAGWTPDPEQGFFQSGMDSLTSLEVRNRLQDSLGITLPATHSSAMLSVPRHTDNEIQVT